MGSHPYSHGRGVLAVALLAVSCGGGGGDDAADQAARAFNEQCGDAQSLSSSGEQTFAQNVTGDRVCCVNEGAFVLWNWINGVVLPFPRPVVGDPVFTDSYQHPGYPPLGFLHPSDWSATTFAVPSQELGVGLVRDDRGAVYQNRNFWTQPGAFGTLQQWVEQNVTNLLDVVGDQGNATVRCALASEQIVAPGITQAAQSVVVTTGNTIMTTNVAVTTQEGVLSQISMEAAVGPTGEYTNLVYDVFMPIILQLTQADTTVDRDEDGIPDIIDNFPADPNRS